MSEWPIKVDPTLPMGARIAAVALQSVADGKLSQAHRLDFYRAFVACGGTEQLIPIKGTTCAVYAGAVLHWAGRLAKLPRYPVSGPTSITSWLNGLSGSSPAWRSYGHAQCVPVPGAIFYVESDSNPLNNHVGVLVAELAPGLWLTVEGGKGDGSECSIGLRRWGLGWDSRRLRGLWLPQWLDHVSAPPAAPGLALPAFPIVKGDARRETVKRWQRRLLAWDPACLPRYGADGGYGLETVTATARLQKQKGLPEHGETCDLGTWEAAEA